MLKTSERNFRLQLFAEDAPGTAAATDPVPAEGNDNGAAAAQDKGAKAEKPEGELKYSDKDLDEIINKKFAKWEEKKQKEVDEAQKLAAMNATQKAEYERNKLQKELDEYKRKDTLAAMSKTARKMLADEGISPSDELLSLLVTTDAEQTKASVESFASLFKSELDKAVQEKLRGNVPKAGAGSTTPMSEIDKRILKYT